MLTHLHIRDFAIIDDAEIEPGPGMTALTGETGAGKSILLDALGLVLGERASASAVREGASRAEVTASFEPAADAGVMRWLSEHDLDADGDCVLRRVVTAAGKSRASINGRPVPLGALRELGARLVSIHGQNAHQALADGAAQRRVLDAWKPSAHLDKVAAAWQDWHAVRQRLDAVLDESETRQQRIDLLRFQLQEFDDAELGGLDAGDIESEHRWLANAENTRSLGSEAIAALDEIAGPALIQALRPLETLAKRDEGLREAFDLVESASIQLDEAAHLLGSRTRSLETDEARLAWLDGRLAVLHRLAKKHRTDPDGLGALEQALRDELDALAGPEDGPEALRAACDAHRASYLELARKLSRHRVRTAKALGQTVTASMQELAMSGGLFRIRVDSDETRIERHGIDRVSFEVSPNPGVSPAPLSRVASGGELSRIGLSLQLATVATRQVPTLIFDEVDAGIGGAVAETVGRLLRSVGEHAQVLCVTHLPQVAARAHAHLKVTKRVSKGNTTTRLEPLQGAATRDEIARMLAGAKVTKKSLQHAQEMLDDVAG